MFKKIFGVIATAVVLMGCIAIPSVAGSTYSSKVDTEGRYIDGGEMSVRAYNKISTYDENLKTTATVTMQYGKNKQSSASSWKRKGSYTLTTIWVYKRDYKKHNGSCNAN